MTHDRRPRQLPTDHAHATTREYQNDHRRRTLSADGFAAPIEKIKNRRTAAREKTKSKATPRQRNLTGSLHISQGCERFLRAPLEADVVDFVPRQRHSSRRERHSSHSSTAADAAHSNARRNQRCSQKALAPLATLLRRYRGVVNSSCLTRVSVRLLNATNFQRGITGDPDADASGLELAPSSDTPSPSPQTLPRPSMNRGLTSTPARR